MGDGGRTNECARESVSDTYWQKAGRHLSDARVSPGAARRVLSPENRRPALGLVRVLRLGRDLDRFCKRTGSPFSARFVAYFDTFRVLFTVLTSPVKYERPTGETIVVRAKQPGAISSSSRCAQPDFTFCFAALIRRLDPDGRVSVSPKALPC